MLFYLENSKKKSTFAAYFGECPLKKEQNIIYGETSIYI